MTIVNNIMTITGWGCWATFLGLCALLWIGRRNHRRGGPRG